MTTVIVNDQEIRVLIAINKREAERLQEQLQATQERGEELEALLANTRKLTTAPAGKTQRRWISKGLSIVDEKVYRSLKHDAKWLAAGWTPLHEFR